MKDIIMAVDESIGSTGVAIFSGDKLIATKRIQTTSDMSLNDRMNIIESELRKLVKKHKVTVFLAEDVYVNKSIMSYRYNLFIQGIIFALSKNIKDSIYMLYHPTHWRKILGMDVKGKKRPELKQMDIAYVKDHAGVITDSDDIADAICIGLAYIKEWSMSPSFA